ncbi:Deoxynucleotidyltransferase terminal-interacting protein 1, variant 2 [Schistosoma haematobium]|uniref:Deoxynucleotidyltransferase terminal-interacting protein 1, variant 2 n=1 Tax=Schistosoma haematobium TaxID=6185 RepID=A0A922LYY0_SCHHA|nr:Deoxynucleotidyltransferase terminal-interacting protein 1, variant 2 [Schistosoma haematobium]KAH9596364.1 Deoxynucleotidyltransferase terminal-interacting protein 1, variant 2 [Schistosoma haematobium]
MISNHLIKHTGLILDAKSTLRLLRKFLQPFVNRDFDQLMKKYMDDFILLAVNNIRDVLGEQSVSESDLTKFRQSLIHRAVIRYFPERPQRDFINHQGTRSNPSPKTGDNKPEKQSIQKSDLIMQSKINSFSAFPSKWADSKLHSRIPTPDSLESSMSFNNSPQLSPIPSSDPISFDKSFLSTNDIPNPTVDKTFQTVYSPLHNPVAGDNESHYSLRNISNNSSLRNVRKRLHPSSRLKISPVSYDTSTSDNSNNLLINTESFTAADCDINNLQEKCTSLPLSSHSPSSASSSSTVGFFRDPFSSDSEGTLIDSSNIKLSGQSNNTQINRSSTYGFHYSPGLSSTIKNNSNAPIHRLKSKSSRGRKTPWWDRTRGKKSKSKVTNISSNTQYDKHNENLTDEKNSLVENDYRQFINTLSNQSVTSSVIYASNNISNDLHNSNQNIHNNRSNARKNTSSRLSRKKCTAIKSTVNNFTTKNSNVTKFTFDQNTHFALGSSANTWLGMGTARGRIYSKHPELFRYICDNEDKAWLVQTGLIISHGVKAYLVHAEQVHQIATQQINSHSSKADIEKLKTFKLPYWFLQKV